MRLRSSRLGVEVIPVYLGFLVPLALPEMQRLLMNFSYTSMARIDLWSGVDQPLRDKPVGGHPRVRYRDLVLTRYEPGCGVPEAAERSGRSMEAAYKALNRIRKLLHDCVTHQISTGCTP